MDEFDIDRSTQRMDSTFIEANIKQALTEDSETAVSIGRLVHGPVQDTGRGTYTHSV